MGQALGPGSGGLNRPKPATSAASNSSWGLGSPCDETLRSVRLRYRASRVHAADQAFFAPPPTVTQVSEQPAAEQMISPTALTSTPTEDEATRAAQSAQEKLKAEKARKKHLARKKRLARERAKAHEEPGSRQQDQMYYGYAALDALQRRDRRPAAFPPMVR
jgi:hypothetical protein